MTIWRGQPRSDARMAGARRQAHAAGGGGQTADERYGDDEDFARVRPGDRRTWALALARSCGLAQENLDLGKSGAQLYAADCAICHKSPQRLDLAGRAACSGSIASCASTTPRAGSRRRLYRGLSARRVAVRKRRRARRPRPASRTRRVDTKSDEPARQTGRRTSRRESQAGRRKPAKTRSRPSKKPEGDGLPPRPKKRQSCRNQRRAEHRSFRGANAAGPQAEQASSLPRRPYFLAALAGFLGSASASSPLRPLPAAPRLRQRPARRRTRRWPPRPRLPLPRRCGARSRSRRA